MEQQVKEFGSLSELLEDLDREEIYGNDRRRAIEAFFTMKAKVVRRPYNGGFELTPFCNFDCKMCFVHLRKEQIDSQHLLKADQWKDIMQQSVDAGMLSADLTGGECLTYPGFEEVYRFLLSKGVRVNVLTNGSLITDSIVNLFAEYRPDTVQISLYGSNDDSYEKVTGQRAFQNVISSIIQLREHGVHVKLSITPHRYMQEDAEAMLSLAQSLGIEYSISSVTLAPRPETGRDLRDYIADPSLFGLLQRKDRIFRSGLPTADDIGKQYRFKVKGLKHEPGLPCGSGRSGFHVNWKGEMTPCVPFYSVTNSILELGFEEAWHRTGIAASSYTPPIECLSCIHFDYCGACPAEKSFGMLHGALNKAVCEKLQLRMNDYLSDSNHCIQEA